MTGQVSTGAGRGWRGRRGTWRSAARAAAWAAAFLVLALAAGGPARAADAVTLRLDWTLQGFHLPFIWALDQGYYAAEGLDVTILEGRGAANVAQLVGSKADTFGQADAGRTALARSQGAPLKVVAGFIQKSEGALVSYTETGIKAPRDIIGKTVGNTEGSSSAMLFRAFLKLTGVPESQIHMNAIDATAKMASLLQGRVEAITGLLTGECVQITQQAGKPVSCLHFADYGVKGLGSSLIVHEDTLKQNPDLVRRFVRASIKGWEAAIRDPAEAARIGHKHFPLAEEKLLQAKLEEVPALMHSESSAGHPLGWMAEPDWRGTIEMLSDFAGLHSAEPPSAYYTNDFLP